MGKYIKSYLAEVENFVNSMSGKSVSELEDFLKEFEKKISFFQHERLIHLLVTLTFALLQIFDGILKQGVAAVVQAVFEDEVFAERNDHERILLAMYVNGRMTANGGQHLIYDVIAHKVNAIDEFLTGDGGVEHRQDESAVGLLELHVLEELLFEQVF